MGTFVFGKDLIQVQQTQKHSISRSKSVEQLWDFCVNVHKHSLDRYRMDMVRNL